MFSCIGPCVAAPNAPIVGTWRLADGTAIAIGPNGDVRGGGRKGAWSQDGRTFVITWFDPKPGMENEIDAIDRVTLSADGTTLSGKGDDSARISATRTSRALLAVAAPSGARDATATAVASASSGSVRVRPQSAADGGMPAYNGLGRRYAAAQGPTAAAAPSVPVAASGANAGAAASTQSAATGGSAGAQSNAMGGSAAAASSGATTQVSYGGAAVYQSPKAPGPPSVSPISVTFTAVNQKIPLSVSLAGFTGVIGFCLAPGNCALGASSEPWSCNAQISGAIPILFQGPGPVTIVMYGPNIPHVNLDCVFYVQAPYGATINYYSTKVLVNIRIP